MATNNTLIALNKSFYVKSKLSHYPLSEVISTIPQGICVLVFETKEDVENYIADREIPDPENLEIKRCESIYDRMREWAQLGYSGIYFYHHMPVYFRNRVSEYNVDLPTMGCFREPGDNESVVFFGASGLIAPPLFHRPWENFQKTDKILRRFVQFNTGYQINPKNEFYAVVHQGDFPNTNTFVATAKHNGWMKFMNGSPLREEYLTSEGAFSIFSDREYADKFWQTLPENIKGMTKIICIQNLYQYLQWIVDTTSPFPMEIGLNPGRARFLQGYFFSSNQHWFLRNVFGIFELSSDLELRWAEDGEVDAPEDSVDSSNFISPLELNLKSTVSHPLKRIMGRTVSCPSLAEAIELVDNEIGNSPYKEAESWDTPIEENEITADSFLVFGFDKISGNYFSNDGLEPTPFIFTDIFEACGFFYHKLFDVDYSVSLNGYSYGPARSGGSNNKQLEDFMLNEKRKGITNLMRDILVNGYKPEYSLFLMKFINKYSATLQLEGCGYLSDLVIYENEALESYIAESDEEDSKFYKRILKLYRSSKSKSVPINTINASIQNKLSIWLGSKIKCMTPESIYMLQSAIMEFEYAGKDPTYDYAGISMKLSKVFERELKGIVFTPWRDGYLKNRKDSDLDEVEIPESDLTMNVIKSWLQKREKIELGKMRYILDRVKTNPNHEWLISLAEFLAKLPNRDFLLSEEMQQILVLISNKYRNGGVHEKMVSFEVCEEAFNRLIINPDGALQKLLKALE